MCSLDQRQLETQRNMCSTCEELRIFPSPHKVLFPHKLFEGDTKAKVNEEVAEFLKAMNALMNEGGGTVYIHADEPKQLGEFDELVDDKLRKLIPDGTSFYENFERHFHEDKRHVLFRVKQRRRTTLSTFNFNTKMSLDKGIVDPTQEEMNQILQDREYGGEVFDNRQPHGRRGITFRENDEVHTSSGVFVESVNVQIKRIPEETIRVLNACQQPPDKAEKLLKFCWEEAKLPMYISAFSRLNIGGSVYFGLHEEKTEGMPKWVPVDQGKYKNVLKIEGSQWQVWQGNDNERFFHVSTKSDVPRKQQVKTGRYLCEGIVLTKNERDEFRDVLRRRVLKDMLWHPEPDQSPVDVEFLSVEGEPGLCVVLVTVKTFKGLSFYNSTGPESYKIERRGEAWSMFNFEDWLSGQYRNQICQETQTD